MSNAHTPNQPGKRVCVKNVTDHSVRLALEESAFGPAGDDSTGILAAVLQQCETLTNFRRRVCGWIVQQQT